MTIPQAQDAENGMGYLLGPVALVLRLFTDVGSAREVAAGAALGMVVGLVPKDNLLAVGLGVLLLALRINLGAALLSAFAFATVGAMLDPVTHQIGLSLLTAPLLRPLWEAIVALPVVPWTGIDNTVVLGNLVLGLVAAYPLYRVLLPIVSWLAPALEWLARISGFEAAFSWWARPVGLIAREDA